MSITVIAGGGVMGFAAARIRARQLARTEIPTSLAALAAVATQPAAPEPHR